MRLLLGAFGDPGHAFPMLALGSRLAARGHDVCLQTWRRWRDHVESAGMTFAAAPEYQVFPTAGRPMRPYEAAVAATRDTEPLVRELAPDACVADILTLAPAWAAERCGVPAATLVPHVCPLPAPGLPPFAIGARLPRTRLGARWWSLTDGVMARGLERGRVDANEARRRLGLPALGHVHTGLSRSLTLVATLPALEYPRAWPPWTRVVGPLLWEPPSEPIEPPAGDGPLVLVAPSTAHDAQQRMLRAALDGLAGEPVRVIATWNGRRPAWLDAYRVPANAVLVPWLSYARTMPSCDVVICHGGHGTLVRALTHGCAVVVVPVAGDMFENAARVEWARVGVRLPRRLMTARTVRLAVARLLADADRRARAGAVGASATLHDAAATAASEVERWAATSAP